MNLEKMNDLIPGKQVQSIEEGRAHLIQQMFNKQDMFCIKVAALLHDLGHGPFSHMWEQFLDSYKEEEHPSASQKAFIHEEMSLELIDCIVRDNEYIKTELFEGSDFDDDLKFIKELICPERRLHPGMKSTRSDNPLKNFLYQIVSNKESENDVDKWDYLARDSYQVGLNTSFDVRRLLKTCQVGFDIKGKSQIMWLEKDLDTIIQIFEQRKRLHKKVSRHRSSKLVEECYRVVFAEAASDVNIRSDRETHKELSILRAHEDPYVFMNMTDGILEIIQARLPVTHPAKEALKRVHSRDFKQLVYVNQVTLADNDGENARQLLKRLKESFDKNLIEDGFSEEERFMIQVIEVELDFGMKTDKLRHPIEKVHLHLTDSTYAKPAVEVNHALIQHQCPKKMFEQVVTLYCNKGFFETSKVFRIKELFIQAGQTLRDSMSTRTNSAIYLSSLESSDMEPVEAADGSNEPVLKKSKVCSNFD